MSARACERTAPLMWHSALRQKINPTPISMLRFSMRKEQACILEIRRVQRYQNLNKHPDNTQARVDSVRSSFQPGRKNRTEQKSMQQDLYLPACLPARLGKSAPRKKKQNEGVNKQTLEYMYSER